MGSFQQIIMGVGCLIAAFWFGSVLQDRPVGQNQMAQLLPDGTIDPNQVHPGSNLVEKTKGFLTSMFESPTKQKPITVDDLRKNSNLVMPSTPNLNGYNNGLRQHNVLQQDNVLRHDNVLQHDNVLRQDHRQAEVHFLEQPHEETVVNDFQENALMLTGQTNPNPAQQRYVGNFQSEQSPVAPVAPIEQRPQVAIVPDFSSLAEEVNRGLSFNNGNINLVDSRPVNRQPSVEMIPVPRFSDVGVRKLEPIAEPNWAQVRQQVAAAESRLQNYRQQMTQPIPAIEDTVHQSTRNFWDRQQAEARRQTVQTSRLATSGRFNAAQRIDTVEQQRLEPETRFEKQERWDVFSNRPDGRADQTDTWTQSVADRIEPHAHDHDHNSHANMPMPQPQLQPRLQPRPTPQPQPRATPKIVEVDRPFVAQRPVAQRSVAQRPQPQADSSARVRSLYDDRSGSSPKTSPYYEPERDRVAYDTNQQWQPREVPNQLRPKYNPNPGSSPEFVSPPDYAQQSPPAAPQTSEIVEAARVTYGSFREYETQPQDTLQTISEKFYGSADYYFDLYLANRDQLSNPATVPAGMTIKIPKFDTRN